MNIYVNVFLSLYVHLWKVHGMLVDIVNNDILADSYY